MHKHPLRPSLSPVVHYDEAWEVYYLELDALGRYFLQNLPHGEFLCNEWPKLTRALQQMPREAFFDFCGDVQEEMSRRNNDLRDGMFFLPPYDNMSLGRNHTRQKLSSIPGSQFHALCLQLCFEIGRRCSRQTRKLRKNSLPCLLDPTQVAQPFWGVERAQMLDNYYEPLGSEGCSPREISRFLDNLQLDSGTLYEHEIHGFHFPETSYDRFNATMSAIYSVFMSILRDKERYANLLHYEGDAAQQVLDLIQMLLDFPKAGPAAKNSLLAALSRLSGKSGLHPRCFIMTEIEREDERTTSGSFGDIWKGRFRGQPVCLKFLKMYQSSSKERLLRAFSREAVLWGHVSHPNLLPFYGIYHLDDEYGRTCLVSPWMDHGNINQYLLGVPTASRVLLASDIAAGLHYLHQRDIVHGDLKGANILVTNSGRACLADFGLSTVLDRPDSPQGSSGCSSIMGGTIRWQAPELLNPEIEYPRASVESDTYAYACVLYEIYVGQVPFYEYLRDVTVIFQIMKGRKPSRPSAESISFSQWGLSEHMWAIMENCWNDRPASRPNISQVILRLPLKDVVDSRPMNDWEEQSASRFRNTIYRSDRLSINILETVLSWI